MTAVSLLVGAVLFGSGAFLILQRSLTRVVIGVGLLGHGANLLLLLAGGPPGEPPVVGGAEPISDPLPQAMVLTAIVISFAVTAFLLGLVLRSTILTGSDDVEDDIEDRRIAGGKR